MTGSVLDETAGPRVILRSAALPAGYSDSQLRRARRSGALTVLAPGVYLSSGDLPDLGPAQWHVAAVRAAHSRLSGGPVVSHLSAAMLLGMQPLCADPLPVHITRSAPAKSRRSERVIAHRASLTPDDVLTVAGLPVTNVARTALDCAFWLPSREAGGLLMAAIVADRLTAEALLNELARYRRVPGVRQVAQIVRAAAAAAITAQP